LCRSTVFTFLGAGASLPMAALAQPIGEPFKPTGKGQDQLDDHADADERIEENDARAVVARMAWAMMVRGERSKEPTIFHSSGRTLCRSHRPRSGHLFTIARCTSGEPAIGTSRHSLQRQTSEAIRAKLICRIGGERRRFDENN
jgi:hypothetical protein